MRAGLGAEAGGGIGRGGRRRDRAGRAAAEHAEYPNHQRPHDHARREAEPHDTPASWGVRLGGGWLRLGDGLKTGAGRWHVGRRADDCRPLGAVPVAEHPRLAAWIRVPPS